MPTYNIDKLEKFYVDSEHVDYEVFAEQRSNLLLIAGEHYNRRRSRYWNRLRTSKDLTLEQKLRLTKNHIQRIVKILVNNITTNAPGVRVVANNEKEIQDQKAAELNQSVWQHAKNTHKLRTKTIQWANDFIGIGEVAVKLFWDQKKGDFVGYEQRLGTDGEPLFDEQGLPVKGDAVFSGEMCFERIYGFNLLLPPEAKTFDEADQVMVRKMVSIEMLKSQFGASDPEKLAKIAKSQDETFQVFENTTSTYTQSKDQALVIEHYVRPCPDYPNGYFYIRTRHVVLAEGELPGGIFPVVYTGYDEIQTKARHRGIIKQLRPYQVEINRSASKMAEHQITLGDDKLLYQSGAKLAHGVTLPGVRGISYTGMKPEILQGRAGEQYLAYMNSQIDEMYRVAGVAEDRELKDVGTDAYALLYRSMREKKKFSLYAEKFEQFLVQIAETYLKMAKFYMDANHLVPAIGKHEYINIEEFKTTEPLSYSIQIAPMADDIESMMGKQLVMNHALQYVGGQLDKEDIGKIMRNMPFSNMDASFDDLTIDYDMATNMILAIDRGETPKPSKYDSHTYMIKRLTHRVRQSDFLTLKPEVQEVYAQMIQFYEQLEVKRQQEIAMSQSKFIPSGGARVKVDFYVPSKSNPNRTERATLPMESVDWLIKKLAQQGSAQETLQGMNPGAQAEMSQMFNQQQQAPAMPAGAQMAGQPGGII